MRVGCGFASDTRVVRDWIGCLAWKVRESGWMWLGGEVGLTCLRWHNGVPAGWLQNLNTKMDSISYQTKDLVN